MDATIRKWSFVSQNPCLCQMADHDIEQLLAAPELVADSPVLVGSLQTTYKLALQFPSNPMCERLFHLLMEVPWCERLVQSLLPSVQVSGDQFVQYACAKLVARVLLALNSSKGGEFLQQLLEKPLKMACLTVFQTILDHGYQSNHPCGDAEGLPIPCTNRLTHPSTGVKIQNELLLALETNGFIKYAATMETDPMLCATLRIWDSALEFGKRSAQEANWGIENAEDILKLDFLRWPTPAILIFLQILNKFDYDPSNCSYQTELIKVYLQGPMDSIEHFTPGRSFGGGSTLEVEKSANPVFRMSALLLLKSFTAKDVVNANCGLSKFLESIKYLNRDWLWLVFSEEDDCLAEALDMALEVYINHRDWCCGFEEMMEPNGIFYSLVSHLAFDHEVLLDWIISNETCFLMYFVKYLKYLIGAKETVRLVDYEDDDDEDDEIERVKAVCKELNRSICKLDKKGIFPFNVKPLVKLLNRLE